MWSRMLTLWQIFLNVQLAGSLFGRVTALEHLESALVDSVLSIENSNGATRKQPLFERDADFTDVCYPEWHERTFAHTDQYFNVIAERNQRHMLAERLEARDRRGQ